MSGRSLVLYFTLSTSTKGESMRLVAILAGVLFLTFSGLVKADQERPVYRYRCTFQYTNDAGARITDYFLYDTTHDFTRNYTIHGNTYQASLHNAGTNVQMYISTFVSGTRYSLAITQMAFGKENQLFQRDSNLSPSFHLACLPN